MSTNNRALQVLSNLPATPGRQVKYLREELEKKETENVTLKNNVTDLTKALTNLQIVTDKVNSGAENVAPTSMDVSGSDGVDNNNNNEKRKTKDKDAPVPAKTAYKYFCEDRKDQSDQKDMRLLWKECQGEERQKYVTLAAQDKVRFENENTLYQTEKEALKMYYEKQKQELAMEFYEAHLAAQSTLAEKSQKNKKKVKDPDAPKGLISSYIFFCQEKREAIVKKNPNSSPTEISKLLGEQWTKLKASKKGTKKYDAMAEKDRQRYLEEKKAYDAIIAERNLSTQQEKQVKLENDKAEALKLMKEMQARHDALVSQQEPQDSEQQSITSEAIPSSIEIKKPRKVKDPNAPKAPKSSYIFFCQEQRESVVKENPGIKPTEVTKILGEEWSKVKSSGKTDKYDKLAAADKVRYEQEMQMRHDALVSQEPQDSEQQSITSEAVPSSVEIKKPKKVKDPNAPKAPKSSYIFFCQEQRESVVKENPGIKPTEITKILGEEWSKVKSSGNTDKYDKLAAADKVRYEQEKQVYEQNKK